MINKVLMQYKMKAANTTLAFSPEDFADKANVLDEKYSIVKTRVFDKDVASLLVCVENPRNEIDNPIRYCAQGFQTAISSFVASTAVRTLPREYQGHTYLWRMFLRWVEDYRGRSKATLNILPGGWEWFQFGETHNADYFVSAYMKKKISAELALQLSGLSEIDFAQMVKDKAMQRDLPIFHKYLAGDAVEGDLPFSEDKSLEYKDMMANEIE